MAMMREGVTRGHIVNRDGLRLAWSFHDGTKRAVICVPGLTRNGRDFEDLAPRLQSAGHRVYAVDLRGRGASDLDPKPERYALATYVQDLLELLDHWGEEEPVIVGVSLGGLIAMAVAAIRPGLWSGAVLDDIGPMVSAPGIERLQSYVGVEPFDFPDWRSAAQAVARINAVAFPAFDDDDWMRMARRQCREGENGRVRFDYDPNIGVNVRNTPAEEAAAADLTPAFDALAQIPVLAVRGALSDILSEEVFHAMLSRPLVEGVEIQGVGHAPTLDEPEAVAGVLALLSHLDA